MIFHSKLHGESQGEFAYFYEIIILWNIWSVRWKEDVFMIYNPYLLDIIIWLLVIYIMCLCTMVGLVANGVTPFPE